MFYIGNNLDCGFIKIIEFPLMKLLALNVDDYELLMFLNHIHDMTINYVKVVFIIANESCLIIM